MKAYRFYFLDASHGVIGAHWLNAEDDQTAFWLAERLSQACSDVCSGFELWHLSRRVDGVAQPTVIGEAGIAHRQRILAQQIEIIRSSGLTISSSRKLLASITQQPPQLDGSMLAKEMS